MEIPEEFKKEDLKPFEGMNPDLPNLIDNYTKQRELTFDSNFESGNLDMAYRVTP